MQSFLIAKGLQQVRSWIKLRTCNFIFCLNYRLVWKKKPLSFMLSVTCPTWCPYLRIDKMITQKNSEQLLQKYWIFPAEVWKRSLIVQYILHVLSLRYCCNVKLNSDWWEVWTGLLNVCLSSLFFLVKRWLSCYLQHHVFWKTLVHCSVILALLIHCRNAEEKTEAKQLRCRKHSIKTVVKSEET